MVAIRQEQHMIRTAITALLVVLSCVYVLVYSVYYRPSSSRESLGVWTWDQQMPVSQRLIKNISQVIPKHQTITPSKQNDSPEEVVITKDMPKSTSPKTSGVVQSAWLYSPSAMLDSTEETRRILSWTTLTSDALLADVIGVEYRYALRDKKGIYYLNLGSSKQDLRALLQTQWWNTFSLDTPVNILANQLFGDHVMFLNMPQYLNKTVLMVVDIQWERRLIQVAYDQYHTSKKHIAQTFIY